MGISNSMYIRIAFLSKQKNGGNLARIRKFITNKNILKIEEDIKKHGLRSIYFLDKEYSDLFYKTIDYYYKFKCSYEELFCYEDNKNGKN